MRSVAAVITFVLAVGGCRKTETALRDDAPPSAASAPAAAAPLAQRAEPDASSSPTGDVFATSQGELRVVPILHGTLRLEHAGKSIYVDPYSADKMPDSPKADLILITDIHPDHFDPAAITKVRQATTQIVAPPVVVEKLPEATAMKNGETRSVAGVSITAVPMYNLKRGPKEGSLYHDKGRGNGYVLELGGKRVYLSGDTECTPEMRALKNIDIAFVCMNLPYTMPPDEALECIKAFQPKVVFPYHYRGSDLRALADGAPANVEVRRRDWYASGG